MSYDTNMNMRYLWAISLVAALGGLLFGYDWVVIGGAKPFYETALHLTGAFETGWAMSSALAGCLVGSMISGALSDRYGRKLLLMAAAFFFTISGIGRDSGRPCSCSNFAAASGLALISLD